ASNADRQLSKNSLRCRGRSEDVNGQHRPPRAGDCQFMDSTHVPGFEADWVPLSRAIFQFCIEDSLALEDLCQKPFDQLTETDRAELRDAPPGLGTLTKFLQKETQASKVDVDLVEGTFFFFFESPRPSCLGGPPWAILASVADT